MKETFTQKRAREWGLEQSKLVTKDWHLREV